MADWIELGVFLALLTIVGGVWLVSQRLSSGRPVVAADAALETAELGVDAVPFQMLVYLPEEDRYEEVHKVAKETKTASISGTQVREHGPIGLQVRIHPVVLLGEKAVRPARGGHDHRAPRAVA